MNPVARMLQLGRLALYKMRRIFRREFVMVRMPDGTVALGANLFPGRKTSTLRAAFVMSCTWAVWEARA